MTIILPESQPPISQDSILAYVHGMPDKEAYDTWYKEKRAAAQPYLEQFDTIWNTLQQHVQDPVLEQADDRHLHGAHTGHRIVTIDDAIGRSARGFYLSMHDGRDNRTVSVSRRKVYAQQRRRRHYVSDSFHVTAYDFVDKPHNRKLHHQLGVLAVWVDKFVAAEPYS